MVLALAGGAGHAEAGPTLESVQGHMAVSYGQLMNTGAPGGSLGFAAGVDIPLSATLRGGIDIAFDLLGSEVVERGSLAADVDYSLVEALLLAHWTPPRGPWRVSTGPGLFHARAALSTAGPAAFEDLAVNDLAPGAAFGIELITRREALVRAGLDVGVRAVWMSDQTWTVMVARLMVHY